MKIYKLFDFFIVTSKETKKLLSSKFDIKNTNISVVEPGIEKLKKYKKIKSKKIQFLTCGSLIQRKKYDYLIKEIQKIDNTQLNIVGDLSRDNLYSKKIIEFINKKNLTDKIILHGKVSQSKLEKLYSKSDFYISTSKYEGFGMALANASIMNLPIITYKTLTIKKTICNSGVLYFDNYKKDTLSNLIKKNCFNDQIYKSLKTKIHKKKYLNNIQSAKLFIKEIFNACI